MEAGSRQLSPAGPGRSGLQAAARAHPAAAAAAPQLGQGLGSRGSAAAKPAARVTRGQRQPQPGEGGAAPAAQRQALQARAGPRSHLPEAKPEVGPQPSQLFPAHGLHWGFTRRAQCRIRVPVPC
ncbi:unnamed protein product [Eretmochelys imbricata]